METKKTAVRASTFVTDIGLTPLAASSLPSNQLARKTFPAREAGPSSSRPRVASVNFSAPPHSQKRKRPRKLLPPV